MAGLDEAGAADAGKMQKLQEELANAEVTGQSWRRSGQRGDDRAPRRQARQAWTTPDAGRQGNPEDLIAAAVNDAVRKIEQNNQEKMSGFTSGMQLPPGFKMPF